ncbi:MAG: FAD-dependent oxidoreductase [Alphaproteobacteria bacterium]|nr:FAD-dependent oxidoreductase [Alphaproteobacteria bacterium]
MSEKNQTVIVGGGISGLMAALAAVERGETDVHVYEASNRLGGKVLSGRTSKEFGSRTINMGAEFIASEEKSMIELAQKLGVPLVPDGGGQQKEIFQAPDGTMMPDFVQDYSKYYFAKTEKIRAEMEKDPQLAEVMQSVSAETFVNNLRNQSAEHFINEQKVWAKPSWGIGDYLYAAGSWVYTQGEKIYSMAAGRPSQQIADTALSAAQHEEGALAKNITATQYMSEFAVTPDRFQACDCGLRVQGGTAALIDALEAHLKKNNVQFHMNHKLEAVGKNGEEKILTFSGPDGEKIITTEKAVIALPAYVLPKIKGLELLKMDENQVQYTKNVKFTVVTKPGADLPEANAFFANSQSWSPEEGLHTFLAHNEHGEDKDTVMKKVMANYAKAVGKRVEDIFYVDANGKPVQGSYVYTNPGDAPCWSTPSPLNAAAIAKLFSKMEALAGQGLAFVGTYFPTPDGNTGFMECGAESVERMSDRMFGPPLLQAHEVGLSQQLSQPMPSLASRVRGAQQEPGGGMHL